MKAAAFDYLKAQSVAHGLASIGDTDTDCKIMAGSQSLGPMLNLRLARPAAVVDVSGLAELKQVTLDGNTIRIGAAVTHAEIEDGVFPPLVDHPWRKVAASIAYRSVRNRGTIGGSIAHADPAADWVLAASAMNAVIDTQSSDNTFRNISSTTTDSTTHTTSRNVNMSEFMLAAYTTALAANEIITSIRIPVMKPNARWGYFKFCRKVGEFAETSCAAYFDPDSRVANIVLGALDGAPKHLPELAARIARGGWTGGQDPAMQQLIQSSIAQAVPERDPIDHGMMTNTVIRCLDRAFGGREAA